MGKDDFLSSSILSCEYRVLFFAAHEKATMSGKSTMWEWEREIYNIYNFLVVVCVFVLTSSVFFSKRDSSSSTPSFEQTPPPPRLFFSANKNSREKIQWEGEGEKRFFFHFANNEANFIWTTTHAQNDGWMDFQVAHKWTQKRVAFSTFSWDMNSFLFFGDVREQFMSILVHLHDTEIFFLFRQSDDCWTHTAL